MPGKPLNITLPTVGVTVGPDYATEINDAIQTIIDDVEAKVVPSEITVNADLSFKSSGTAYAATNLDKANFEEQSAALGAGNTNSLFAYDDELYYQDGVGNNVQLTSAGSVGAVAGNITTTGSPAYATSGVELLWSGGDLEYRFKDGSGANDFADIVVDDVEFRNGANTMTMDTNVTTDYTLTWPATAPGSTLLAQVDSSGNISFSNTVVNAATFSGLITASAGLTAAANQHVTISGSGRYKHGNKTHLYSGAHASVGGTGSWAGQYTRLAGTGDIFLGIPIPSECEIAQFEVFFRHSVSGSIAVDLRYDDGAGTSASVGSASPSTTAGAWSSSLVSGLSHQTTGNRHYYLQLSNVSGNLDLATFKIVWSQL